MNRAISILPTLLLLIASSAAEAATFCVSTGTQLNSALASAGANQEDDVIKIEFGTLTSNFHALEAYRWQFTPSAGEPSNYSLTLSGGWSRGNNCQSVVTTDPSATVLDAQNVGPVFVADLRWEFSAVFSISNLTFTRGRAYPSCMVSNSIMSGCPVAGLHIEAWATPGAQVVVDNVLVTAGSNAASAHASIARFWMERGSLRLRNSIFAANALTTAGTNSRGVELIGANGGLLYVSNNSMFNNSVRTRETGFISRGIASFTNNAIADNTTTDIQNYQFYSSNPGSLSFRNNHFQTRSLNGTPAQDIAPSSGAAGWTLQGIRMIPNADSPLRDSGENVPTGGALAIDFSGGARILNGTMDRGAVEAPLIPPTGPMLSTSSPTSGSTTAVIGANTSTMLNYIQFMVSGGTGGTTQLTCAVTAGTAQVTTNGAQTINTGGSSSAVTVSMQVTNTPTTHTVTCTAQRENASTQTFTFHYFVAAYSIMSSGFED